MTNKMQLRLRKIRNKCKRYNKWKRRQSFKKNTDTPTYIYEMIPILYNSYLKKVTSITIIDETNHPPVKQIKTQYELKKAK